MFCKRTIPIFKFHYDSINSIWECGYYPGKHDLNSIMILLIPTLISSLVSSEIYLNSIMILLIQYQLHLQLIHDCYLNSIMILLILLWSLLLNIHIKSEFKFHYDSINSCLHGTANRKKADLNSIMILLIPFNDPDFENDEKI